MKADVLSTMIAVVALVVEKRSFVHSTEVLLENEQYNAYDDIFVKSKEFQLTGPREEAVTELVNEGVLQEFDTGTLLEEVIRVGRYVNEDFPGIKISELEEADDGGYFLCIGPRLPFFILENFSEVVELCEINGFDALRDYSFEIASSSEAYAPASDRLVSRNDNLAAFKEIDEELAELERKLSTDNVAGEALAEDRDVAIAEVGAIRKLLTAARSRASVLLALSRKTLGWIADKCAGAAIGEVAKQALMHILRLFS